MKKFFYLFLLFFQILFFFLNYGCEAPTGGIYLPGFIKGTIYDSTNHRPLAGVNVQSNPISDTSFTDENGNYILSNIPMSSSGTSVWVTASKNGYITNTKGVFVPANDTAELNIFLLPGNGVYIMDNISVRQTGISQTLSGIDLYNLRAVSITYGYRDIDLRDSASTFLRFQFRSSHLAVNYPGFYTRFGYSLGNFSKSEFDTLAMYYGAGEPLSEADFPRDRTDYFYTPLTERSVIPFYLMGRYIPNSNVPRVFGLLYIKNTWLESGSNIFWAQVDVKINRNGQNYFRTTSK